MNPKKTAAANLNFSPQADFKHPLAGPVIVALCFSVLAVWTWHKGGNLTTDFGHQAYLAWRLSLGDVLYRDVVWIFGPVAHYINAIVFFICGVSLANLLLLNLGVIFALVSTLYFLVNKVSDRFTATITATGVLAIFCFGHMLEAGNFNFLTPYSHDATYGTLFCVLAIMFLYCHEEASALPWAFLAGACAGLALLTKFEIAVASLTLALLFIARNCTLLKLRYSGIFFVGLVLPALTSFILFLQAGTPQQAVAWTFAAFTQILHGGYEVLADTYQVKSMGLDQPWENIQSLIKMSMVALSLIIAAVMIDVAVSRFKWRQALEMALAVAMFVVLYGKPNLFPWIDFPRALTVVAPFLLGLTVYKIYRNSNPASRDLLWLYVYWLCFACVLLTRLGLHARFYHYGFFLALPATIGTITFFTYIFPMALKSVTGNGKTFRALAIAFTVAMIFVNLLQSAHYYQLRTESIGEEGDRMYFLEPEASLFARRELETLHMVQTRIKPGETLAVIPCGAYLNYLLRSDNPTGLPVLDLNVLRVASEDGVLERFKAHPPHHILITKMDAREYGISTLGQDDRFAPTLWNWVLKNYQQDGQVLDGAEKPFATLLSLHTS